MYRHLTFHEWIVLGMAMLFVIVRETTQYYSIALLPGYPTLHILLEFFTVVLSFLMFGIAWNRARTANVLILSCVFFVVGCIDFLHILTFSGSPLSVSAEQQEDAIYFRLAARYLAGAGLLAAALWPRAKSVPSYVHRFLIVGTLIISMLVFWFGLSYQQNFPNAVMESGARTSAITGFQYGLVILFAVAAIVFNVRLRRAQLNAAGNLFAAAAAFVLGELSFIGDSDVANDFNLLGHVNQVIAYCFVYRAVFVESVVEPYRLLQEAELKFHELFRHTSEGIALADAESGFIVDCNPEFERLVGRTLEQLQQMHIWELHAPELAGPAREAYLQSYAPDGVRRSDLDFQRLDGTRVRIEFSVQPLIIGGCRYIRSINRNIDELKPTEKELQRSTDMLHAIFEAVPTAIIDLDLDGNVHSVWNSAAEKMFGWSAREVLGRPLPTVLAENQEEFRRFRERISNGETMDGVEVRRLKRDGTPIDYSIYASPLHDEEGRITGNIAVLVDITERKRRERERLAHLRFFESMDQINRAIQGTSDIEQMMNDVLDVVLSVFGCDRAFLLYPCDPEALSWNAPTERTRKEYPGVFDLKIDKVPMDGEVADTFRVLLGARGPVKFGPGSIYPLPGKVSERFSIKSLMSMAIYPKGGKPWQFGIHQCSYPRIWSSEEERLFQGIAQRLTDSLTSLIMLRSLRESQARLDEAARMAQIGYWNRDYDANSITLSEEAYRIFGLPVQEPPLGSAEWRAQWRQLIHPEDYSKIFRTAIHVLRSGLRSDMEFRVIRPNGEIRTLHSFTEVTRGVSGRPLRMFGTMQDITERRQADEKLRMAKAVVENSPTILFRWLAAKPWSVEYVSENIERLFGYTPEELLSSMCTFIDIIHPDDRERVRKEIERHSTDDPGRFTQEYRIITKDGRVRWIDGRTVAVRNDNGEILYFQGILIDITEKYLAKEKEREALKTTRTILEAIPDLVWLKSQDGIYMACNPTFERFFGARQEEIVGKTDYDFVDKELADFFRTKDREAMAAGSATTNEEWITFASDSHRALVETVKIPIHHDDGRLLGVLGIARDITSRMAAEQALRHSEDSLKQAQRIARLGNWQLDLDRNHLTWSEEIYRIFEIDPDRFDATYEAFLLNIHPDDREAVQCAYTEHLNKHRSYDIVHRLLFEDGRVKYVHGKCKTIYDQNGKPLRSIGTMQDVTDQQQAELALRTLNHALRTISAGNEALVRAGDEAELLHEMCRVITDVGNYRAAWVGYADHGPEVTVRPIAQSGFDGGNLETAPFIWAETDSSCGPTELAVRNGEPQYVSDLKSDTGFAPWREDAVRWGYSSLLALPLCGIGGNCFGALTIIAAETNAFDEEEIRLLQDLSNNLGYGIVNLRTRQDALFSEQRVRRSLEATIEVIASTVEMRDPYTAGHERRVAMLAVAIAREMGLADDRIEGIHFGALIHDFGKIKIPAEILNKPGPLNPIEFELMKTHPQVGYEILKDIEFPWPVAQMVLQHHEHIDGSGYPQGLQGDAVALEARILSVADVVESMFSHRPYRPALGLDAALEEIRLHSGSRYDTAAVDACMRLFREKDFEFS